MHGTHERNDRYSLLLHRDLARLLRSDESLLARGRRNILRWQAMHGHSVPAWDEWLRLIDSGADAVAKIMVDEGEEATRLRQSTPFAGIVPNRRRWELLKESRREAG